MAEHEEEQPAARNEQEEILMKKRVKKAAWALVMLAIIAISLQIGWTLGGERARMANEGVRMFPFSNSNINLKGWSR